MFIPTGVDYYDGTQRNVTFYDLIPTFGSRPSLDVRVEGLNKYQTADFPRQKMIVPVNQRDNTARVLPCRNIFETTQRRPKIGAGKSKLLGAFPQIGNFRSQEIGLQSDAVFKLGSALMPNPDTFNAALNSLIPVPPVLA
jgi:hypothetical protein